MINFPLASKYLTTARLKPFLLFFLVIAFITGLGLILLKEDEQKVQVVDKNWLQIRPERLEQNIGLVGRIEAVRQQTLSAPFEGVIKEIMVQEVNVLRLIRYWLTLILSKFKSSYVRHREIC